MAEDVLINFVGKTDELKPAEDVLESIIVKEGEIGAAWKKTSEVMAAGTKQSIESSNKLVKSIDAMAVAAKSMDKVIVAGAYKQYLKEIQSQLGLTSKELVSYVQNARKAAQEAIFSAKDEQEIKELTLSIEVMNDQLVQLGVEEDKVGEKTVSLRARLKAAKDELVALADAGITSGPAFDAARKKAGELDDQVRDLNQSIKGIGSDTKKIDGLISLAGGVAGGFAIAQGAAALFGSENEEVQKALLKVNAAMAILQGLQQIQLVLQKESAASLLFSNTQRATAVTTTVAQTVATEGAVVAQTQLNTAMSLNPVGILILGIVGLISLLSFLDDSVEDSAKTIEHYDGVLKHLSSTLDDLQRYNDSQLQKNIANLNKNNALQSQVQREQINGINQSIDAQLVQGQRIESLYRQFREDAAAGMFTKDDFKKQNTEFYRQQQEVGSNIFKLRSDLAVAQIDLEKTTIEEIFKSQTGFADATVARRRLDVVKNQIDTIESIRKIKDAEIEAIKASRDEELKTSSLTAGERSKINADANLKIAEQQKAFQKRILEIQKADINAKLIIAQKGSEDEFDLRVELLHKQQQIELEQTELTLAEINEIKNKYRVEEEELIRKFNEEKIQNEISYLNSYLDEFGLSEERKLELTIRRLDRQRDLEISQAEGNAAKIREINAKYDKLTLESRKAAIQTILSLQLQTLKTFTAQADAAYNRTLANDQATIKQKMFASDMLLDHELRALDAEKVALDKKLKEKLISQEQYTLELADIFNRRSEAEIAADKRVTDAKMSEVQKRLSQLQTVFNLFNKGIAATIGSGAFATIVTELEIFSTKTMEIFAKIKDGTLKTVDGIKAIASAAIQSAQGVINQLFADASAQRLQIANDQIAALEEQKQRELSVENITMQQKADIENRFRQQEKRIKIEAFNADKEAKKSQALINGALAATLALAEYPWPYSLIVAGIIAGLTGIEIAEINRQQPRFKEGKIDIDGPGTATSDSISARISKGESVINAKQTAKHKEALESINNDTFDKFLNNKYSEFIFPQAPENVINFGGQNIDYGLLAKEVAKEMKGIIPSPAQINNIMDSEGLRTYIIEGSNQTEIKNKRYSMD